MTVKTRLIMNFFYFMSIDNEFLFLIFSDTNVFFPSYKTQNLLLKKKKKSTFPLVLSCRFLGKPIKKKKKKNLKITITKQLLTLLIPFTIELKVSSPITPPLDYLEKQKGNFWWCWILQRCIAASTTLMIEIAGLFFL